MPTKVDAMKAYIHNNHVGKVSLNYSASAAFNLEKRG